MPKVLIVDDDPALREVVRFALARDGFDTDEAADGAAALQRLPGADLVVLDVAMPGMDGIACCRALRRTSAVPVLFLSSRDEEVDRIVGLEVGGDDYLGKPFSPRELVARIRAILRRPPALPPLLPSALPAAPALASDPVLRQGRLLLDPGAPRAAWDGREVPLTATEFGILRTLMARAGRVVSRDALMDGAYATERVVSDRTIDSHVRRLRVKFAAVGAAPVETLPGFGYRLGPCI